ncbi:MAG: metal ABC transporter substrate-binding protein [Actinomycetota bacterium]|nr:metal ABC transporter substrate-binding protein [Actinomycetota bacterium]
MAVGRVLLGLGFFAFLVAGCGSSGGGGAEGSSDRVQVAASISVIGDLTEEVAGDRAEVFTIVPAGADVHTFQPSPSDAQKISGSEVVFQNGLGLEAWMDDLVESAGGEDVRVVKLAEGLETLEGEDGPGEETSPEDEEHATEEGGHEEESHAAEEHAHEHAEGNPHLWLDVHNAGRYVEKIRDALVEADPEGVETYRANAEEYLAELEELDAYVEEKAASIPEDRRKLVTFHDAFPYFAAAYGFELVDVILQNPEAEPSGREAAELVRKIEAQRVSAVFTEPQFNQGLANTIADEAGVEVYELYSDALADDPDADSYEDMMRTNIDRVAEGLGR